MGDRYRAIRLALLGFLLAMGMGTAAAAGLEAIGLRGGTEAFTIPEEFDFQALDLRFRLPWSGEWKGWDVATHLDASTGHVAGGGRDAWLFTFGPSLTLLRGSTLLDFGLSPSVLTRDHLNGREFGGWFQFTSHIGIYHQVNHRWRFGYRIQHTSNGSIYDVNDGFDVQTLELWIAF